MDQASGAVDQQLCSAGDELGLIENEMFDFDLPVSPQECAAPAPLIELAEDEEDREEDEDEVFMGPVGFKEQCVATNAELTHAEEKPMSPPSAEQYAHLFKEAMSIALELEQKSSQSGSSSSSSTSSQSDSQLPVTRRKGKQSELASGMASIKEDLSNVGLGASEGVPKTLEERGDDHSGEMSNVQCFKRQVKRDMRNDPRRNTYTVAANQPSPYPTAKSVADESKMHVAEKREMATSKLHQPRPPQQIAQPNGRGSRLPMRGRSLRRPAPLAVAKVNGTQAIGATSNGSGLRKPAVKRLSSPKSTGLKKPGFTRESTVAETKTEKPSALKAPIKKLSLVKPSSITRPGQRVTGGTGPGPNKAQPMKATMSFSARSTTAQGDGNPKRTTPPSQLPPGKRKAGTPCTPVCQPQEKKVMPKRLLSGGGAASAATPSKIATPRRSSIAGIPRPSTPTQIRTPRSHTRHSSITIPPSSVGPASARRRSGLPTPNKMGSTVTRPTSRLASGPVTPRTMSTRQSKNEIEISPLFLSPLQTPPEFKLSPEMSEEVVKPRGVNPNHQAEVAKPSEEVSLVKPSDASPDLMTTKTPVPAHVLRSRTNVQGTAKETTPLKTMTPKDKAVGMLIDFGSATPKEKRTAAKPQQRGRENLIDL